MCNLVREWIADIRYTSELGPLVVSAYCRFRCGPLPIAYSLLYNLCITMHFRSFAISAVLTIAIQNMVAICSLASGHMMAWQWPSLSMRNGMPVPLYPSTTALTTALWFHCSILLSTFLNLQTWHLKTIRNWMVCTENCWKAGKWWKLLN